MERAEYRTIGSCPKCSGTNITWDGPDIEDDYVYYTGHCDDCNLDFKEWYSTTYIETVWEEDDEDEVTLQNLPNYLEENITKIKRWINNLPKIGTHLSNEQYRYIAQALQTKLEVITKLDRMSFPITPGEIIYCFFTNMSTDYKVKFTTALDTGKEMAPVT